MTLHFQTQSDRAWLKLPESIWCCLIRILTYRKYLSIMDKRCDFSRPRRSNGRARLKLPGLIWDAPFPVCTDRKYLPIVHKMCNFSQPSPNESNHELSWPLVGIDKWIPSTFMNFHETSWKVTILIWTCGISWYFMAFQGSMFHQKFSEIKNHKTFANFLWNIANIHEKRSKLISWKFAIFREWSSNPVIHQFQFTRVAIQWWYLYGWVLARFVLARGVRILTSMLTSVSTCFLQGSARWPNPQTQVECLTLPGQCNPSRTFASQMQPSMSNFLKIGQHDGRPLAL